MTSTRKMQGRAKNSRRKRAESDKVQGIVAAVKAGMDDEQISARWPVSLANLARWRKTVENLIKIRRL